MKEIIKSLKKIPVLKMAEGTMGFMAGYFGSKVTSEKAGGYYPAQKEWVEFGASAVIAGGTGFAYTKVKNEHASSILAGATIGTSVNATFKLLKTPQVNNLFGDNTRNFINLFGDGDQDDKINTLSGNYAELFDYAKGLESRLQSITGQQPALPARATDMGTAIEDYATQVDGEIETPDVGDGNVEIETPDVGDGENKDPYAYLNGDEEEKDPYDLLGQDQDPYAYLQGED